MKRLHLFEFHDQLWFPETLRNEITLILELLWTLDLPLPFYTPPYLSVLEILDKKLENVKNSKIIDLCSGSGGPLIKISQKMNSLRQVKVLLTDLYPNHDSIISLSGNTMIAYEKESVDASKVPSRLFKDSKNVIRTIFAAFHHLREDVAKRVLKDTIENSHGIMIVDLPDRSILSVISQVLLFYVAGILYLAYVRPVTLTRLLLLPLVIVILTIDGVLSSLRSYSKEDYWRILAEIPGSFDGYSWKITKITVFSLGSPLKDSLVGSFIESIVSRIFQLQVLEGTPINRVN